MKNWWKYLIAIVLFILLMFIVSTIAYQRLVNEGSALADSQCLLVNPAIIDRKNSYIRILNITKNNGTQEEFWEEQMKYKELSKLFVRLQEIWLKQQKKYIERWDYLLFVPAQIKAAGSAQYKSRAANTAITSALAEMYDAPDINEQKKLFKIVIDETKKRNEADNEYNKLWQTPLKFDLRTRFIRVPKSTCPQENLNIPDVIDSFSTPKPIQSGPVT